ncbi:hypothetical protein [Aegicerativicinus sediminis]|uniref:hypothetical protein n=1 Tax=Aegicerativicinus sediminis TaxID=2893202 RepID=UPI001E5F5C91|nr:hypothetical protein [Aegicerativicinus sediminis]
MKSLITLILFVSLPIFASAQDNSEANLPIDKTFMVSIVKDTANKPAIKIDQKSASQLQVIDLNYKKSLDLVSIKAYRKSLQIKVKTIKRC